ncbi:hypothetical protein BJ912DRAFT_987757, partial [Pholiota molesta]
MRVLGPLMLLACLPCLPACCDTCLRACGRLGRASRTYSYPNYPPLRETSGVSSGGVLARRGSAPRNECACAARRGPSDRPT